MRRVRRSSVKTRQPKELQLAYGVSILWLAMVAFYAVGASLGRGDPTWAIVFGVAAVLAWVWAVSAVRKRNAARKTLEELRALSPDQFEEWTAARFRDLGYSVKVTGRGGDHGADLIAEKVGETAVVQCKRYGSWSVGEPVLRDLLGAMHDFGAGRAYLVTTGRLTQAAADWAKGKPIEVWDGEKVVGFSAQVGSNRGKEGQTTSESASVESARPPSTALSATIEEATCRRCGSALVERRNRRTGEAFLGCARYPECRHTQPVAGGAPAGSA